MITCEPGDFQGQACLWLSNGLLRLAVTSQRGPRILFWGWQDGPNLFAELPDFVEQTPRGPYHFLGGHRLWYAPEHLERTYWIDAWQLEISRHAAGARFVAPPDGAGIARELSISLDEHQPRVLVEHTLRNAGVWTVELAPWALSMCRTGGLALFPQPQGVVDPQGYLPNRRLILWPYSDPSDRRLHLGNQVVLVSAQPGPPARNKLGYLAQHGWMAYLLEGTLFSKHVDPRPHERYPDYGCNVECFFNDRFIELESLGPLALLEPGASVVHQELWRLHPAVGPIPDEAAAVALAERLGLASLGG